MVRWGKSLATAEELRANASLTAGLSALSSQATIALINNGGDIGKALQDLGSADSIRNLATAMITAGLTSGISGALGIGPKDAADALSRTAEQKLADYVQQQAVSSAVRTLGDVANGKDMGASLRDNLKTFVVSAISAELFKTIGDLAGADNLDLSEGSIEKIVLHATAGCAIGAAASKDCFAGALGAGLQEALSGVIDDLSADPAKRAQYAGLIASTATFLAGGDSTAIGTANQTANDAREFNRELHRAEAYRLDELLEDKDEKEKDRLRNAACFLVHCADGVPENDPNYAQLKAMQDAGAVEANYQQKLRETGLFRYVGYDPVFDFVSKNYATLNNSEAITRYILSLGYEIAEGNTDWSGPHGQDIKAYLEAKMLDGLSSSGLFEDTAYADYLVQRRDELGEQAGYLNVNNYIDSDKFWQGQGVLDSFNPDRPRVPDDQGFITGALAWLGIVDKPSTLQEAYVSELLTRSGLTIGEVALLIVSARSGGGKTGGSGGVIKVEQGAVNVPEASRLTEILSAKSSQTVFWSGLGREGDKVAADYAAKNGLVTLETSIAEGGINMPSFVANEEIWRTASLIFAQNAKGTVRVLTGDSVSPTSIWVTVEFPALQANKNVTKIIRIDPVTGKEDVIFKR